MSFALECFSSRFLKINETFEFRAEQASDIIEDIFRAAFNNFLQETYEVFVSFVFVSDSLFIELNAQFNI